MNRVKVIMLVKTKAADNNNKFYEVSLYEDGNVVGRNGRVGTDGVLQKKGVIGQEGYDRLVADKKKGGYREVEIATTTTVQGASAPTVKESLADIAKRDITNNNPFLNNLIDRLTAINRFQLLSASGGQIDIVDGEVKTPLGLVTLNAVNNAKVKLSELQTFVETKNLSNDYVTALEDYLTLVPQKIPLKRGWESGFFSEFTTFHRQSELLEQLENSINSYKPAPVTESKEPVKRLFGYSIELVSDADVFGSINSFYKKGINRVHVASDRKMVKLYRLTNKNNSIAFDSTAKRIGNLQMLWHGTRAHNVLSILKNGLIIPPENGEGGYTIAGRMFGRGCYFSDQSTKSLNYSAGYWSGARENGNIFMLNACVAMGRSYIPSGPTRLRPPGYDSIYAVGGRSGVQNNEMIVDDLSQIRLDYLCEFE